MRSATRKRVVREEAGFTLAEMMVTMMIMIVVLFALYSIFDMSLRIFSFGNDKVEATENARLGMEKMEREIRAAYPVDRINGKQHVFFNPGAPLTAALPPPVGGLAANQRRSITFGNDLPQPPDAPNRQIANSATGAVDPEEVITYRISSTCPNNECTLVRETNGGSPSPVVEYIVPDGLTFEYLRSNLTAATATDGTDIGVVRITLEVNVDGVEQTLTTDVDLRNRGG